MVPKAERLHQIKRDIEMALFCMREIGAADWRGEIEWCKQIRDRVNQEEDLLFDVAKIPDAFVESGQ